MFVALPNSFCSSNKQLQSLI